MSRSLDGDGVKELPVTIKVTGDIAQLDSHIHMPSNSSIPTDGSDKRNAGQPNRRAVFLDRDGVLVEDVHFLVHADQLNILPGVGKALKTIQDEFLLIVTTNQSGIARGLITEDELAVIHEKMLNMLQLEGARIDALFYCPHLPDGLKSEYAIHCDCRKPEPGMILQAAKRWGINLSQSFMVGDSPRDIESANRAGVIGIKLGGSGKDSVRSTPVVRDLCAATTLILDQCLSST